MFLNNEIVTSTTKSTKIPIIIYSILILLYYFIKLFTTLLTKYETINNTVICIIVYISVRLSKKLLPINPQKNTTGSFPIKSEIKYFLINLFLSARREGEDSFFCIR